MADTTTKKILNDIFSVLIPGELNKNPLLASVLTSAEGDSTLDRREEPTEDRILSDRPVDDSVVEEPMEEIKDEDFEKALGVEDSSSSDLGDEEVKTDVGPYDLTFSIRKVIASFNQVVTEAERLRKLTEEFSNNMSNQQKANWIQQRRFFIAMSKDAEKNWKEFKDMLVKFKL